MQSSIVLLIGSFLISTAYCTLCPTFKPCPSITLLGDTTRPEVLQSLISGTILNLWKRPKPTSSKYADDLQKALVSMLGTGNCDMQNTTMGSSYLYWILTPQLDRNPGLCTYAAIAQAVGESCEVKKQALQGVPAAFSSAARLIAASSLENSGCGESTYVAPLESCPNGGRKIDIDVLISKINNLYPADFICALKEICKSKKFHDQIACIGTASTSLPEFRGLIAEFSDELRLSFFNLFMSPEVPPSCCADFTAQLNQLLSVIDAEALRATNVALSKLPC